MSDDLMENLARYAPPTEVLGGQAAALRDEVLDRTVRFGAVGARALPLRDPLVVPARGRRTLTLIAACAVILLVAGIVGGLTLLAGRHGGQQAGGRPTTSTDVVGPDQFAYSVKAEYVYAVDGSRPILQDREENWVAPDGAVWTRTAGADRTSCSSSPAPHRGNVLTPSVTFFDGLPTDAAALNRDLRRAAATRPLQTHLAGSPSIDAVVVNEVEVMLDPGDLLASPALRTALIKVLEMTPGVTVHRKVSDQHLVGATRIDQTVREGSGRYVTSLYFDPDTARYLGGRTAAVGAHPVGRATLAVITRQQVVDAVPAGVRDCSEH